MGEVREWKSMLSAQFLQLLVNSLAFFSRDMGWEMNEEFMYEQVHCNLAFSSETPPLPVPCLPSLPSPPFFFPKPLERRDSASGTREKNHKKTGLKEALWNYLVPWAAYGSSISVICDLYTGAQQSPLHHHAIRTFSFSDLQFTPFLLPINTIIAHPTSVLDKANSFFSSCNVFYYVSS